MGSKFGDILGIFRKFSQYFFGKKVQANYMCNWVTNVNVQIIWLHSK